MIAATDIDLDAEPDEGTAAEIAAAKDALDDARKKAQRTEQDAEHASREAEEKLQNARRFDERRNFREAAPLVESALEIHRRILGKENLDYSKNLGWLGGLYRRLSNYDRAELAYNQGLSILERLVGQEDPKGFDRTLGRHAAAHVEEIGRLAAVQLDDVHGGHGQPGPVD